jgi:hypothetical protein
MTLRSWLKKRLLSRKVNVVTFDGKFLFHRYQLLWWDEWVTKDGKHYNRPPWWRPFNAFLHRWAPEPGTREGYHDHPRWSITVCLRGRMTEHTPWGDNVLTPGKIILRSHKYIHAFSVPEGFAGKTWTLFIVGRRNHRQNSYVVKPE